ncbi:30S ribosomal protein S16 [candidate division WWE3 bacterium RBG_19FT_COMBO_34_6]|uniref:Small ribosomal subunit protein bS16 n=1 Tax=candidate division WWE3 bacterium RBG_19FT_COMBO_34_6 TaxID=1802612 RepID=A0A1F4UL58_UNCKA|nr:MAG: 30S ribosomal protein S16 [candidate division WWE3 bacterium RBG_19FT_COMBO_34_6]
MSVKIRLAKFGKKHAPTYRLVASHTRTKRNGQYLEILGSYDPHAQKNNFVYDKEKLGVWQKKGATLTDAVKHLLADDYKFVEYSPQKVEKTEKKQSEETAETDTE